MSLVALVEGKPSLALDPSTIKAVCRDPRCEAPMYRRAAAGMVPHWAHAPGTADRCDARSEMSQWHAQWQTCCTDAERVEFGKGKRRADVYTRFGWAVEFQHSNMTTPEVHAREDDWNGQLIWVHDGTGHNRDNIHVDAMGNFEWLTAPSRIFAGRCHQLVDIGDQTLAWLSWNPKRNGSDLVDETVLLTHQQFIDSWLMGDKPFFPYRRWTSRWERDRRDGQDTTRAKKAPEPRSGRLRNALSDAQAGVDDYRCDRGTEVPLPPRYAKPCIDCSPTPRAHRLAAIPPDHSLCADHWPEGRCTGKRAS